jgi:hypothetical protein
LRTSGHRRVGARRVRRVVVLGRRLVEARQVALVPADRHVLARPGLEDEDVVAVLAELVGDDRAADARTDDDGVEPVGVCRRRAVVPGDP